MKQKRRPVKKLFLGEVPEVMDIKTLAQYLGMGRSKIYGLIRQKKIPASRIGRQCATPSKSPGRESPRECRGCSMPLTRSASRA